MTPWGLRNRIKSALGRAPSRAADVSFDVQFVLPDGASRTVRAEERYTLVMASQSLETPIATGCPDGHCGDCRVDVLDATGLAPPSEAERKLLTEKGKPGQRLACHARVTGPGARVKVLQVWTMDSVKGA